jgi:hypothetical protein
MDEALRMPDVHERLAVMALEVAIPGSLAMKAKLEDDAARWLRLAQEPDIKLLD